MVKDLHFEFNNQVIRHGDPTIVCGIVNVTPDSFSDGGKWYGKDKAVERALDLIDSGCGMIDIGGESTRPGSTYVDIQEEIDRVVPVIKEVKKKTDVPLSIDTWKAEVAQAAIDAGVDVINDITGLLGDPDMAKVLAQSKVGLVAMFNPVIARPDHPGSKIFPKFGGEGAFNDEELAAFMDMDEITLMKAYFEKTLEEAHEAGLSDDRIQLDPGIGFGLTKKENLSLIRQIEVIHEMGYTCFLGVSRKRFIQNIISEAGFSVDPDTEKGFRNRDLASTALTAIAAFKGVEVVRVHVGEEHAIVATVADMVRLAEDVEDINFLAYKN